MNLTPSMALMTSGEKLAVKSSSSSTTLPVRDAAVPLTPAPAPCNVATMFDEPVEEDASRLPIRSRPERLVPPPSVVLGPRSRSSTPLHVRMTTLGVRSRLIAGRLMQSSRGSSPRNMRCTQGAIVCVDGLRK